MRVNELKRKLAAGEVAVGSFAYVPAGRFVELLGLIGFDFVVIDLEHGPIDMTVAEDMVRAAETRGTTPLIRVSHNSPHLILRALDIGAAGVHVPEVNDSRGRAASGGELPLRAGRPPRPRRRARRGLRPPPVAAGLCRRRQS